MTADEVVKPDGTGTPNETGTPSGGGPGTGASSRHGRIARRVSGWLLLIAAIPIGAAGGAVGLLVTAAATGNRMIAAAGAALSVVICAGGLAGLAARGIARRRGSRRWLVGAATVLTLAAVAVPSAVFIYAPGRPGAPPRVGGPIGYWDLPTGSRIGYAYHAASGDPRPTPVISVHGGPGAPDDPPEALVRELNANGFAVYDYDQVGAGLSSRLADVSQYTVARHVADLEGVRERIGAEQVVLVGASWGGTLIANYLAAHPDRVAYAVIASPGEIWSPATTDAERLTDAGRLDQQAVLARYPRFSFAHVLLSVAGPDAAHTLLPDAELDGMFESFVGQLSMRPGCAAARPAGADAIQPPRGFGFWVNAMTSLNGERAPDPRPALRNATAPVLVLRGECDYLSWPIARDYRDVLPNARLLPISGAGHTIAADRPELYRELVLDFLMGRPLSQPAYLGADPPW